MKLKQQTSSWLTIFFIVCIVHIGIFSLGFNFSRISRPKHRPQVFVQTIQLIPTPSKISLMPIALAEETLPQKNQAEKSELKIEKEKPKEEPKPISTSKKEAPKPQPCLKTQQEKKLEIKKQEVKPKSPIKKEESKQKDTIVENQKKDAEKKKLEEDKKRIQQEKAKEIAKKEAEEKEKKRKAEEQAKVTAKEKEIQEKLSKLKHFKTDKTSKVALEDSNQSKNLPKTIDKLQIDHLPTVEFSGSRNVGREEMSYRDKVHHFLKHALILPEFGSVDVKVTLNKSGKVVRFEILKKKSAKNASYLEKIIPSLVFPIVDEKLLDNSLNYTFTILLDNG